jgi:peptidoglycan/LPS O-acetylase OafA/YrhL
VLLFYFLFPLLFSTRRPWLSALAIAVVANVLAIVDPLHLQAGWLHRLHTNAFSLGMLLAWLLSTRASVTTVVVRLRDGGRRGVRLLLMGLCLLLAPFATLHNSAGDWPRLGSLLQAAGLDPGFVIGQVTSLTCMAAVLLLFVLARRETALLALFGTFSYETYLLHWPLMSRYDVFYHSLPAWLATVAWLGTFIALGWLLQRVVSAVEALIDARPVASAGERRAIS